MLLRPEYRDRAVGLIGAYAVLIAGIVLSGALESVPAKSAMRATEAALDRAKTARTEDCSTALQCRPEIIC
jgi:hypothetical protein